MKLGGRQRLQDDVDAAVRIGGEVGAITQVVALQWVGVEELSILAGGVQADRPERLRGQATWWQAQAVAGITFQGVALFVTQGDPVVGLFPAQAKHAHAQGKRVGPLLEVPLLVGTQQRAGRAVVNPAVGCTDLQVGLHEGSLQFRQRCTPGLLLRRGQFVPATGFAADTNLGECLQLLTLLRRWWIQLEHLVDHLQIAFGIVA
ncbi:hypothetical protein D3C78_1056810 [compost metagenome]